MSMDSRNQDEKDKIHQSILEQTIAENKRIESIRRKQKILKLKEDIEKAEKEKKNHEKEMRKLHNEKVIHNTSNQPLSKADKTLLKFTIILCFAIYIFYELGKFMQALN